MTERLRTVDENFDGLEGFDFAPSYHVWQDLRMHYLDVGPRAGPVALLLHGMPTWSYVYRSVIPRLANAGFRCIAPDHLGFGRSDKPTDEPELSAAAAKTVRAYLAPFAGLPDAAYNGLRRFPLSIPFDSPDNGNAAMQAHCFAQLLAWKKPTHFIWGCRGDVFPEASGRSWATRMKATFDALPDAGHFLQNTHGPEVAELILRRMRQN
jgi:pimeloyl-ACP methyl ester carboxylesterase